MQLSCQVETDAPRKTASLSLSPNLRMEQHHLLEVCWGLVGFNGAVLLQWIASAEWNHAVKWLEQSLHSRCNLVSVVLLHMLFNMWTDFWRKQWFPVEGKKPVCWSLRHVHTRSNLSRVKAANGPQGPARLKAVFFVENRHGKLSKA